MSATLTGSYDPSQVVVVVGALILSGFSDGDSIMAERYEDNASMRVGIDGAVGRARNANKTGFFTFRLLSTGSVNTQLSALFALDNLSEDAGVIVPIAIYDGSGTDLAVATKAWLKKSPSLTKGKDVGENEWVFDAADMKIFLGGNN